MICDFGLHYSNFHIIYPFKLKLVNELREVNEKSCNSAAELDLSQQHLKSIKGQYIGG